MQLRVLSSIETEIKLSWISFLKTAKLIFFFSSFSVKYNILSNFLSYGMDKMSSFAELEIGVETLFRNDPNPDPCNKYLHIKIKTFI